MKTGYIGNGIQQMRREAGMTQQALADAIGVERYQLSYFENGRCLADWETVQKLSKTLGCTVGDIYRPAILDVIRMAS